MSFPYAERLMSDRDNLTGMAHALSESAAKENRDLSEPERAQLAEWQKRCADIDAQLATHGAALESERAYAQLRERISARPAYSERSEDGGNGNGRHRTTTAAVPRSAGEVFTESDQFRNYAGTGTARVDFDASVIDGMATRSDPGAGGTTPTAAGGLITFWDLPIRPYRWEPPAAPAYQTPIMDVVSRESVSVGAVEWVRWEPTPMTAAPKVEEGAPKPQAELTARVESAALDTFAFWVPITRQALDDEPRIRSIIEGKLREGLLRGVEGAAADALVGDTDIPDVSGGGLLGAIRKGLAMVQAAGYRGNAVLLNPMDWADFDIGLMVNGNPSWADMGTQFWGLRPVPAASVPSGTAYVGDFRGGLTFFDRRVTSVYVTDSHADFFTSNKLVILAETRGLAAVTNPYALVKATGDPATLNGSGSGGGNGTRAARSSGTATAPPAAAA